MQLPMKRPTRGTTPQRRGTPTNEQQLGNSAVTRKEFGDASIVVETEAGRLRILHAL